MSEHTPDLPQRPTAPAAPAASSSAFEPTGDAAVDGALADLAGISPDLEPAQQLPVLVAVHEALQQRLSSTEA